MQNDKRGQAVRNKAKRDSAACRYVVGVLRFHRDQKHPTIERESWRDDGDRSSLAWLHYRQLAINNGHVPFMTGRSNIIDRGSPHTTMQGGQLQYRAKQKQRVAVITLLCG